MSTEHDEPHQHEIKHDIEKRLRAIYEVDGKLPDLTKLEQRHSSRILSVLLVVAFVGVLSGAAWVGFLLFGPSLARSAPRIEVQILGSEHVASMEMTTLTVTYANPTDEPIAQTSFHLNLPQEFRLATMTPEPTNPTMDWVIGSLNPGEKGTIVLTGNFTAQPGSRIFVQAISRYRPGNFNSDFQDITTKTVTVDSSKLTLSLEAPTEAIAGEPLQLKFTVKNPTDLTVEKLILSPKLPDSFLVTKTDPKPAAEGSDDFSIEKLAPGKEQTVTLEGVFTTDHATAENITGSLFAERGGNRSLQADTIAPVRVIASELSLRTLVNGSSNDQTTNFGDVIRLSAIYKNNGERAMKDVTMSVTVNATPEGLIDWKAFDDATEADKSFVRKGETLTFNKKLMKSLASLEPGTEGTLSYNFPLAKGTEKDGKKYTVVVTSKATVAAIGTTKVGKSVETTPFTVALNSDLGFTSGAKYFDESGVALGSGPLPPQVGQKTKYLVEWIAANSVHELRDLTVKTQLPEGVEWTGKSLTEAGTITFDAISREVKWQLARVPTTLAKAKAQFEVELTPKESQVDGFVPFTTGATLSATDVVTQSFLTKTTIPDTTELIGDEHAKDKGLVQK